MLEENAVKEELADRSFDLHDVIATGWRVFCQNIRAILLIVLLIYVPINFGLSFVPVEHLIDEQGVRGLRIYMKIIQLSEFLFGVIAMMAIARLVESSVCGQSTTWGDALRCALSRWGASVITGLLAGLIVLGMTLLLIVPGIIWSLYYYFFLFVVALRGLSGKAALDYSKSLVQGQWWRVFGYSCIIELFGFVIMMMLSAAFFFTPEARIFYIVSDTVVDIVSAVFLCMKVVFFLHLDYVLRHEEPTLVEPLSNPEPAASEFPGLNLG